MSNPVLIVSALAEDVDVLTAALAADAKGDFRVEAVSSIEQAALRLVQNDVVVILSRLELHGSFGVATYRALAEAAPSVPILILAETEDDGDAQEALAAGARGILARKHFADGLLGPLLSNVIARVQAEDALHAERERAYITLNSMGNAVVSTDAAGRITYLNVEAERLTAWPAHKAKGRPVSDVIQLINSETRQPTEGTVAAALQNDARRDLPVNSVLVRPDGVEVPVEDSTSPIHDSQGNVTGALIVLQEASSAKGMHAKMAYLAQHDFLTGLPNRALFLDRLEQALALAARNGTRLAVLYLDLDNFKAINDTLGHEAGDHLLQSVAKRLQACVRTSDTVSRQGGDEFVVLVNENRNVEYASLTAKRVLAALAEPHALPSRELLTTTSIGISVYPADGQTAAELLKNADTAMYYAKRRGRNNYQFFNQDMNLRVLERQEVEGNLRSALRQDEFVLQYQPKVNLKSGDITGAEVLLRWQHPERGWLGPDQFVQIAEESGLMVPIGRWVVREACIQAKAWSSQGLGNIPVSVNISLPEFRNAEFLEGVRSSLEESGLEPQYLELELTENVLRSDLPNSGDMLHGLKALGVQLVVDDFGTGYSNLSRLKQIPVDSLKIDQSFIQALPDSTLDTSIVEAIIRLGTSLNHRVIAEGIETREQMETLQAQDCEEGQGYYFSRPVDAEQFSALIKSGMAGKVAQLPH